LESVESLLADLAEGDRNRIFSENAGEFYRLNAEIEIASASTP